MCGAISSRTRRFRFLHARALTKSHKLVLIQFQIRLVSILTCSRKLRLYCSLRVVSDGNEYMGNSLVGTSGSSTLFTFIVSTLVVVTASICLLSIDAILALWCSVVGYA